MADQQDDDYQSVAGFTPDLHSAASTSSGSYRPVQPHRKVRHLEQAIDVAPTCPVMPMTPDAATPEDAQTSTSSSSAAPPSPNPLSVSDPGPLRPSPAARRTARKAEKAELLQRLAELEEETEGVSTTTEMD